MIKISLQTVCTLLLLTSSCMLAYGKAESLDKIIVIVDQRVILQSEMKERIEQVSAGAVAQGMALPDEDTLRSQILDHLISEQLQLQMASRVGFKIPDEDVVQTIERIRVSNNLSPSEFEEQLKLDGLTRASLYKKIRKDITIQQIQQAIVQQRIQVSSLEIDNFLKSAEAKFWMSPEYHLGHILLSLPQSATADEVAAQQKKAEQLVAKIRSGESFANVAIAESNGQAALQGGDIGWRKTTALPSLFADIVPTIKVGEVSDPARSPAGFHILTVYETRGGEETQLEQQAKVRHILVKTSAILDDEAAQKKLVDIRKKILDGASFEAMAKEHSEDIGSMLAGGDLGWTTAGMFVPAFADKVRHANPGDLSEPFKSQYGWHILEVQERREQDITEDILRQKAATILTKRRFEDELQVWLRELRDEAYIDIKI